MKEWLKDARLWSARPALDDGETCWSYGEMLDQVQALAAQLQMHGITRLALESDNTPSWVIVDLACALANIALIPIPPFFSADQKAHCLKEAQVQWLICPDAPFASAVLQFPSLGLSAYALEQENGEQTLPNGTQKITYTSGSTGQPKGVCLSTAHQWLVARSLAQAVAIKEPQHVCLLPLSVLLENIAGIYAPLLAGGKITIWPGHKIGLSGSSQLDPVRFVRAISEAAPQSLILLPQLLLVLVNAIKQGWQPPHTLQFIAVGGGKVSPSLLSEARAFGLPVYEGYGLSECASVVALNTPATSTTDEQTGVGKPLAHCQVSIQSGEVVVEGSTFLGYLGQPETWYPSQVFTGDRGRLEEGHLTIDGRIKNTLITAFGRNVQPEWVEAELTAHPLVQHALVVGESQPHLGALLLLRSNIPSTQLAQMIEQTNQRLPDYAQLHHWQAIAAARWQGLITANGRIRREMAQQQFADDISTLFSQRISTSPIGEIA